MALPPALGTWAHFPRPKIPLWRFHQEAKAPARARDRFIPRVATAPEVICDETKFLVAINLSDKDLREAAAVYFGPVDTNGTWRFIPSGSDLVVQRRESGSYVTKSTFSP